jgi:Na+/melibiose symporter-like transporter
MKNNKQMPDEPMLEGKPASAWGWFLAGFVWLVIVFVLVVPAAFTHDPAREAAIEELKAQAGINYTFIVFGVMAIALAPFMIALNRAVHIKHQYRKERGMTDAKEEELYERGNFFAALLKVALLMFVAVMIYVNVAPAK